jgi:hypothetical protein
VGGVLKRYPSAEVFHTTFACFVKVGEKLLKTAVSHLQWRTFGPIRSFVSFG